MAGRNQRAYIYFRSGATDGFPPPQQLPLCCPIRTETTLTHRHNMQNSNATFMQNQIGVNKIEQR
jgi:hypothetical protein